MNTNHIIRALALAISPMAAAQTGAGQLYTQTNAPTGNEIAIFDRASNGMISFRQRVATGGLGTGGGLGNQGAVILTQDQRFLLAVNAGSNDLSVFRVDEFGLTLIDVEAARGVRPVSVTQHDDMVYVVNAGTSSITGFTLEHDGQLRFLWGSLARLSAQTTAPAQIQFGPRGQHLYVTEKATNRITRFALDAAGLPTQSASMDSPGATPFGFGLGRRGQLIVSEAAGGAAGASTSSSYVQLPNGGLQVVTAALGAGQSAACWIAITPDGRLAFTTNTADDTVSTYNIGFDGTLSVRSAVSATTGDAPTDMAVTPDGRFFYVLNRDAGSIGDYVIDADGNLVSIPGSNMGLPTSATGLAVR